MTNTIVLTIANAITKTEPKLSRQEAIKLALISLGELEGLTVHQLLVG